MRKAITTLVLLTMLAAGKYAAAQTIDRCGTTEYMQRLIAKHPGLAKRLEQQEIATQNYLAHHASAQNKGTEVLYKIPVVVHVIFNGSPTTPVGTGNNISVAQIQSQIDVLNGDYGSMGGAASVPAPFNNLRANCQIQFSLAKQDPQGNVTNGITRTFTTETDFDDKTDYAKFTSKGGHDAWPSSSYLNLWVVPNEIAPTAKEALLGYAQFPTLLDDAVSGGGPAATDGVVIAHFAFGMTGTATFPTNVGRTATHEVGHWLNLRHIWGDRDGCYDDDDDGVGDTPNQFGANRNCPTFPKVSCPKTKIVMAKVNNIEVPTTVVTNPEGDMFMNYMDYTADACQHLFTIGQKARMRLVLETPVWGVTGSGFRASLKTSQGCASVPCTSATIPTELSVTDISNNTVKLNWKNISPGNGYTLQWKLTTSSTLNTEPNIFPTASSNLPVSYLLKGLTPATSYSFRVASVCGGTTTLYSTPVTFTTSTGTCPNDQGVANSNNTRQTAKSIPVNTTIMDKIINTTDNDYFTFTTTADAPNVRITLSGMNKDYDVELFRSLTQNVAISELYGSNPERIIFTTGTPGQYWVRVYGFNDEGFVNNYDANICYNLCVSTSSI